MSPDRTKGTRRTGKNKADNGSKWIRPEKRWAIYRRDTYCCIYCEKPFPILEINEGEITAIHGLNPIYEKEYNRVKDKAGINLPPQIMPYSEDAYQFLNGYIAKKEGKPINDHLSGGQISSFLHGYNYQIANNLKKNEFIPDGSGFTLDHFRPTELGGTNDHKNLGTACKSCNSSKQAKSTKEFLIWLEENRGINPVEVKARIKRNTRRKLKK
jgi:5-methylcytosine-specific restriction endonuclease McrA